MTGTPYLYQCSAGHGIGSSHQLAACPVCVKGQTCCGQLKRVGAGSRGPKPGKGQP